MFDKVTTEVILAGMIIVSLIFLIFDGAVPYVKARYYTCDVEKECKAGKNMVVFTTLIVLASIALCQV